MEKNEQKPAAAVESTGFVDVDGLIADLEERGLGWSLDHTGNLIESRIWDWPNVIGRYRPTTVEPLSGMLSKAMYGIDWTKYPKKTSTAKLSHGTE